MKKKDTFENIASYLAGSLFNILFFIISLLIILVITLKAFQYGRVLLKEEEVIESEEMVAIEIPEDASQKEIALILKEAGLISNEYVFMFQTKLNGTDRYIRSGNFELPASISANDLMVALQTPLEGALADQNKITIPEGLTIAQVAEIAEAKELFTKEAFIESSKNLELYENYDFIANIPDREFKLQGYLFPDTYFLPDDPSPAQLIARMLHRFDEIVTHADIVRAEELGLTLDEVMIMASIVEKETSHTEERQMLSSLLHNRLREGMSLEVLSPLLFILDTTRDNLSDEALEYDSPYNTFLYGGLPPGPIAAPGRESIDAILYPEDYPYLYMVLKDEETDEHYFTDNYDEYLEARELYNQN